MKKIILSTLAFLLVPVFAWAITLTADTLKAGGSIIITPSSGDANFIINNSSSVEKATLTYNSSLDEIDLSSTVGFNLSASSSADINIFTSSTGELALFGGTLVSISTTSGDIEINSTSGDIKFNNSDLFISGSNDFVHIGGVSPLTELHVTSVNADTVAVLTLETTTTNGADVGFFVGTQDPEGLITGNPGDHYYRINGTSSDEFIFVAVASGTAGWETIFSDVAISGTPVDNQLAVWTSASTLEGTTSLTFDGSQLLTGIGTELLPAVSFVSDPSRGMRLIDTSTTITGVTDLNGFASFTHAGTSPAVGRTVTVSGFTTNTDYNQTGTVTVSTSTTFRVASTAFGTSETGSFLVTALGFSERGFTALQLSAPLTSTSYLLISAIDNLTIGDNPVSITVDGETDTALAIDSKGSGELSLNTLDGGGVAIGRASTGQLQVSASGVVAIGSSSTAVDKIDGRLLSLESVGVVDTRISIFENNFANELSIGIERSVVTGDGTAFFTNLDGTEVTIGTSAGDAISISSLAVTMPGSLGVTGTFLDTSGDAGTSGQLLSSILTGTNWIDEPSTGNVSSSATLTDNFLVRGNGTTDIDIGNMFMSSDGNDLTVPGQISSTMVGGGLDAGMFLNSTTPALSFNQTDASTDNGLWHIAVDLEQFRIEAINDADTVFTEVMTADRTGTVIDSVGFPEGEIIITNNLTVGTVTNAAKIHALTTTEQLRLGYDATNYSSFTVAVTGFDVSTAVYDSVSLSIAEDAEPRGMALNSDNTKLFVIGNANITVYQYTLTTAGDLSTASYDSVSLLVSSEDNEPQGIVFNSDDTMFYIVGNQNDSIYQYSMTTASDLSTASYDGAVIGKLDVSAQDLTPTGIAFNSDGTKLYHTGQGNTSIYQYSITAGDDIVNASYDGDTLGKFDLSSQVSFPQGIKLNSDNTKFYVADPGSDFVYQYSMSDSDLSTASYNSVSFDLSSQDTNPTDIEFNIEGTKMYMVGIITDTVYQYSLDISDSSLTIAPTGSELNVSSDLDVAGGITNSIGIVSSNPSNIIEIHSASDFDDLASGGIVTISAGTTFAFKASITTANRIVVDSGISLHMTGEFNSSIGIVYSGTDTFFTTDGGSIRVQGSMFLTSTSTGTFMSFAGSGVLNINASIIIGWDDLGTFTEGNFLNSNTSYVSITSGWTITDPGVILATGLGLFGADLTDSLFTVDAKDSSAVQFSVISAQALSTTASVLDLSSQIGNDVRISVTRVDALTGTLYKQSILTDATINSVTDNSPATGTITAMATNSEGGTTFSSTTTYFEGEEVTLSGTTSYDGDFQIFNVVAGVSFDTITAFVADDATGSIDSVRIDLALTTGHGIVAEDDLKFIDTNFYNGFVTALNFATTDVLTVNGTFITTDTGSIERELSLDETDPRVNSQDNRDVSDSQSIFIGSENANTTATTITDGTYVSAVFSGITINQVTEGFRLVDASNYKWEYIRNEPFNGLFAGSVSMLKSGSTANYRMAMSTNSAVPTFATAPYIPIEVKTTQITKPFGFSAVLTKGDTIEIMIAGDGTSNALTLTDILGGGK